MRSRRRNSKAPFGWISALFFHVLMAAFVLTTGEMINETRDAQGIEFEPTSEALAATQEKMGQMFADLVPAIADRRVFWASQVDREVRAQNLVSARGYLLAAPYMLDRQDAAAVLAASNTETRGRIDDRLLSAAKPFLPDDVRARYERAVAPRVRTIPLEEYSDPVDERVPVSDEAAPEDFEVVPASMTMEEADGFPEPESSADNEFFVLGNARDLAFQSAGWIRGDRTDVFALSLSGLGLIAREGLLDDVTVDRDFFQGASLLKSAIRANRLEPDFEELLRDRLERAMPEETLRANLDAAFSSNANLMIEIDPIFEAFANSVDTERLRPFMQDLTRIAVLAEERSGSAALTLISIVSSHRDLKRAELISLAGGDRSVTLAEQYGPEALDAATTIMDWTLRLILLVMAMVGLLGLMLWTAFATLVASTDNKKKRLF